MLLGHVGWVDAEAVAAGGVHVEFGRDSGVGEGLVIGGGVAVIGLVVFCLDEERGWRELVWGVDGVKRGGGVGGFASGCSGGWRDEVCGVDDDGEAGAGVDVDVSVGRGRGGGDVGVVGVGGHESGEVAAGGEADDADFCGVDVPRFGVNAGEAHRLLRVFEWSEIGGVVAGGGDAVFDEDAGDVDFEEPVAGGGPFAVPGEADVAAAGEDEGGGAVRVRGSVDGERGAGDVGEARGAAAVDEAVGGLGDVDLGIGGGGGLGEGVRPEGEGERRRLCVCEGCGEREGEGGKEVAEAHGGYGMRRGNVLSCR